MRLDVERSQVVGLAVASVLFSFGFWLQFVLVDRDWRLYVFVEVVVLALLWGAGLWILNRYRDEWGPYFPWDWRKKDEFDGENED